MKELFSEAESFVSKPHNIRVSVPKNHVTTSLPNMSSDSSNHRFNKSITPNMCKPKTRREAIRKINAMTNKQLNMGPNTLSKRTIQKEMLDTFKMDPIEWARIPRTQVNGVQEFISRETTFKKQPKEMFNSRGRPDRP